MASGINLIKTGFNLIDNNWGGVYQGGSYVVIGPHKSGRTLLGLQFAVQAAKNSEVVLFFTTMRPKDLMIQAASLNFNVQAYMNKNLLVVVRVAPPVDIEDIRNHDEFLIEYMNDIVAVVGQYNPNRIIFDELTPYIGFKNIDLLRDVFLHTLETIEDRDITSLFILGDPATEKAAALVETIASVVTGRIYLRKKQSRFEGGESVGTATIIPNVGHNEGKFSKEYIITPRYGVMVEGEKVETHDEEVETEKKGKKPIEAKPEPIPPIPKTLVEDKKKLPARQERIIMNKTTPGMKAEPFKFSNIYNKNDFELILNNQIALFKSTGQMFHLLVFKLNPAAIANSLLTMKQFQKALENSVDKKDKITFIEDKVIILVVRSTEERIHEIIENIKKYLPSDDETYITRVTEYISLYTIEPDDKINNAEKLLELILSPDRDTPENYIAYSELV